MDIPDVKTMVFVFGSNESGRHGAGAARYAFEKKQAVMGFSYGHIGHSFAIPTMDQKIQNTLHLEHINAYVLGFLAYAASHPEWNFQVTCIGCGLAGLKHEQVAPMFKDHPGNCYFDTLWKKWLPEDTKFWGTVP
jgi:hypothetical protein